MFHGCIRLAVKLDFIAGLLLKARGRYRRDGIPRGAGAGGRNTGLAQPVLGAPTDAMSRNGTPWTPGYVLPNQEYGLTYRVMSNHALSEAKGDRRERTGKRADLFAVARGRFQNAGDTKLSGSVCPRLERVSAVVRVKLMKLLWDAMGTEFGGRHGLYERNYFGNQDRIRIEVLMVAD